MMILKRIKNRRNQEKTLKTSSQIQEIVHQKKSRKIRRSGDPG
jgi:hypothetical protein